MSAVPPQADVAVASHNGQIPLVFLVMSFEGPDSYAHAGGLGTRTSGLTQTLAEAGFETHLFFIGAPDLPGHEVRAGGRLHLHRWCQWISQYHPGGVYDGEEDKLRDWDRSLPTWLEKHLLPPLLDAGRTVVIMAEEWQTGATVLRIKEMVTRCGWQKHVRILWNANNTFSFDRVPWTALKEAATITTVSRYMKHQMWRYDVDAHVIPNGLPQYWFTPPNRRNVEQVKRLLSGRLTLMKVAPWDPDKRWLMAVDAVAELKWLGLRPLLLARGGVESHGREVLYRAKVQGLTVADAQVMDTAEASLRAAIEAALEDRVDMVLFQNGLSHCQLRVLYRATDAVLANSGLEPFGLVGLEAMASGGLVFVGATGEEYLLSGHDGISLQTSNPAEIVGHLLYLRNHPDAVREIRRAAKRTASHYTWLEVLRRNLMPLLSDLKVQFPLGEEPPPKKNLELPVVKKGRTTAAGLLGPFGRTPSIPAPDRIEAF